MSKIFCIGFPKTGTTSIEEALTILGYKVCKGHFNNNYTNYLISLFVNNDFDEIDEIISNYDVFIDLPWGGTDFYKYLMTRYENAKFIFTKRESESWYRSFEGMITQFDSDLSTAMNTFHSKGRYGVIYYIKRIIGVDTLLNNKSVFIDYYDKLNTEIILSFKNSNHSFLEMNVIEGEGWDLLCSFLNKSIPNKSFPHLNKKKIQNTTSGINKWKRLKSFFNVRN